MYYFFNKVSLDKFEVDIENSSESIFVVNRNKVVCKFFINGNVFVCSSSFKGVLL